MTSDPANDESKTPAATSDPAYTKRLIRNQRAWWKRLFPVQAPYRWNLRRLRPGFTLVVGCGIGRDLVNLSGSGVGLDHNAHSVAFARSRGLEAFTPGEFFRSPYAVDDRFDSLLLSHVAEHMPLPESIALLRSYLRFVKPCGQIILITPQERTHRADPTHVEFMDFARLRELCRAVGAVPTREYSFPLPRAAGRFLPHNEFVLISLTPPRQ